MKTDERRIFDLKEEITEAERNSSIVAGRIERMEEEIKDLLAIESIDKASKCLDKMREEKEGIDIKIKEELNKLEKLVFNSNSDDED